MAPENDRDDLHTLTRRTAPMNEERPRREGPSKETLLSLRHPVGTEVALLRAEVPLVVGRHPPSDICIADRSLSRTHARFTLKRDGRVFVEDLGSTNGTKVAGARVTNAELALGAEALLGDVAASLHVLETPGAADLPPLPRDGEVIAVAPAMKAVVETAVRLAASSIPVVLHGETGTGKEVFARLLHTAGPRLRGPLVSVSCAAIPETLLESVLFGHERGAFTGAVQPRKGVFEEAHGGTLFLDEIGEMPLAAQASLLRVLETKRVTRVGSVREISIDTRIVVATHRDLDAMVAANTFRADLYFRLNAMTIEIPPLRDRSEEVEPLVRLFLERAGHGRAWTITPEAFALLRAYPWPGNVRELRNVIERAVVVARGSVIGPAELPEKLHAAAPSRAESASDQDAPASVPTDLLAMPALGDGSASPMGASDYRAKLVGLEARMLVEALQATGWRQADAAKRLGIPARTLSNKLKALGIKKPAGK